MRVIVGLVWGMVACGPSHTAQVDVVVTAQVQSEFSAEQPGEIVLDVITNSNFGGTFVLGVLCEPAQVDRTAPWILSGTGCATEAQLTAWIRAADPASTCAGPVSTVIDFEAPGEGDPVADGLLYEGFPTGCPSLDETVVLTPVYGEE